MVVKLHRRISTHLSIQVAYLGGGKITNGWENSLPLSLSRFGRLNEKKIVTVSMSVGGKRGKGNADVWFRGGGMMMVVVLRTRKPRRNPPTTHMLYLVSSYVACILDEEKGNIKIWFY